MPHTAPAEQVEFQIQPRAEVSLSPEDHLFWRGQQPEKIIFATGSWRKAMMWLFQQEKLVFPQVKPPDQDSSLPMFLAYQTYLGEQINNSNKYKHAEDPEVLVGYYHGVPVYMRPSLESSKNESAVGEAQLKVESLQEEYSDQHVWILATDTIDFPKPPGSEIEVGLGKPENELDFPRLKNAADPSASVYESIGEYASALASFNDRFGKLRRDGDEQTKKDLVLIAPRQYGFAESEIEEMKQLYLEYYQVRYYPLGTQVNHINGAALLETRPESEPVMLSSDEFILGFVVSEVLWRVQALADAAGGGLVQQLVQWPASLTDEAVTTFLNQIERSWKRFQWSDVSNDISAVEVDLDPFSRIENPTQRVWALYCQIVGMPFAAIDLMLQRVIDALVAKADPDVTGTLVANAQLTTQTLNPQTAVTQPSLSS